MSGVRANVTRISFFVLFLYCWGITKSQTVLNDPGQNQHQQHFISKQRQLANEKLSEAIEKARSIEKYAAESPSNVWINNILNTLENHLGKIKGSQADVSQIKKEDINEFIERFAEAKDLDKGVPLNIHSPKPAPSLRVLLKNVIVTCLTVTGLLFIIVLLLYIFASLCMKSRPREPPVNNTYNIYITEDMKKKSASIKDIFSEKREDTARMRPDTPNLRYLQSPGHLRDNDSKGKLFIQNSNFNNRAFFAGDFGKGQIMPLNGLIIPSYRNLRRPREFISSSELSDSDAIQNVFLPETNCYQTCDVPDPHLQTEYMKKNDPNNAGGSQQDPNKLSLPSELNDLARKSQYNASLDSLYYAEETQSDIYPSSYTTENSELVENSQEKQLTSRGNVSSPSWPSHSD
ncbi:uncharacterized protein LOC103098650 isoform X2 [Monodelphis domestica]|uniref:uncharacterized protein LOC103098650 isoform X2 n=1 Tax=Monodelphis domestica TaxID=13616 RepID=UPI0024E274D4|nr:uncharacterized protein LOC103098650 isoform X2 [Monodelphis domestica]